MADREQYKSWIKDYCNDDFLDDEGNEELPAAIEIALDKLVEADINPAGLKSKTKGQKSESYTEAIPQKVIELIRPYRKMKW